MILSRIENSLKLGLVIARSFYDICTAFIHTMQPLELGEEVTLFNSADDDFNYAAEELLAGLFDYIIDLYDLV